MTALASYIPALKREVALPGEYDTEYPNSDDGELLGGLADAFGQAQLDGFLGTVTLDLVTSETDPDISLAAGGLLVLYAAVRILQIKLVKLPVSTRYKAGPVEYQVDSSAGAVTALLKALEARKAALLENVLRAGRASNAVHVTDGYLVRSQGYFPNGTWGEIGGFYGWELGAYGGSYGDLF